MESIEINNVIENLVKAKISELSTWKKVRWEGGRLYYETTKISNEIADYSIEIKILYLEKLLNGRFIIQDNWPSSAPDITNDFKNWLVNAISKLKINKLQNEKVLTAVSSVNKPQSTRKKKRPPIPYKTKTLLQKEVNSACPFCQNSDVAHFQIHHMDENPENNQFKNLLMVCAICHSKITKNDISRENVFSVKERLLTNQ